ncbi:hypothetical protein Mth01_28120 [Sphaerimonospora thailandensis]|uniref:Uncharacterized protein n=2 Tax=Sphaerimonospora thailandensis TaxID=795644 RepID=A0A8J3R9K7_9ACTN|nr:hypothetical protein Mth01_28120 [Sphaerimonospora thailandensis]
MAVLLALGLIIAWSVLIPGFMDWDDMVTAVIGSLRLTGPVAAMFTAWVALRRRRANRGRALTPWRAAKAPLGILAVVICSFAVTVLLLGLRAALADQSGHLPIGGLAMCVAGLALYVMIGWTAGWVLPFAVTPVIAGIGTYGLFTWVAVGSSWADRLTPATRRPYDLFAGAGEAAFTDQTLWLMGLSTALLLGWIALVTRRMLAMVATVIAMLAAGTGAARLVAEPRTVAATERLASSCQSWPFPVCVRPSMRDGLTELAGVFTMLARRLADTPAAFDRVEQRDRADHAPVPPGVAVVHLDDLSAGFSRRAVTEFLDRLARPCPGTISNGYRSIVASWLRGEPLPAGPLPEHRYAAVWFSGLTEDQRHNWLRMFYSDFASCRLQSRHFGGGTRPADPNLISYPVNPTPAYAPAYPVNPSYHLDPEPEHHETPGAALPPRAGLSPAPTPAATPGLPDSPALPPSPGPSSPVPASPVPASPVPASPVPASAGPTTTAATPRDPAPRDPARGGPAPRESGSRQSGSRQSGSRESGPREPRRRDGDSARNPGRRRGPVSAHRRDRPGRGFDLPDRSSGRRSDPPSASGAGGNEDRGEGPYRGRTQRASRGPESPPGTAPLPAGTGSTGPGSTGPGSTGPGSTGPGRTRSTPAPSPSPGFGLLDGLGGGVQSAE